MDVSGILERAIELSVGVDNVDTEEEYLYLKYLNMAANELYQRTAGFDELLERTHIEDGFDESGELKITVASEDMSFFLVKKVMTANETFKQVPLSKIAEMKFKEEVGDPVFAVKPASLVLYSKVEKPYKLFVSYVPKFKLLKDTTVEADIPFRPEFHELLVYGTLYYIYQDIDGFKSSTKESVAAKEWNDGIVSYQSTLFNTGDYDFTRYTRI